MQRAHGLGGPQSGLALWVESASRASLAHDSTVCAARDVCVTPCTACSTCYQGGPSQGIHDSCTVLHTHTWPILPALR